MRSRGSNCPANMAFLSFDAATLRHLGEQGVQRVDLFEHRRAVGGELRRARVELSVQNHGAYSVSSF